MRKLPAHLARSIATTSLGLLVGVLVSVKIAAYVNTSGPSTFSQLRVEGASFGLFVLTGGLIGGACGRCLGILLSAIHNASSPPGTDNPPTRRK